MHCSGIRHIHTAVQPSPKSISELFRYLRQILWPHWRASPHSAPGNHTLLSVSVNLTTCVGLLGLPYQIPHIEWLEQQKFIFSQCWRLDMQIQSAVRSVSWWNLSSRLADRHLLTSHELSCGLLSVRTERQGGVWCLLLFHKDLSDQHPSWPYLPLIALWKALYLNTVTLEVKGFNLWLGVQCIIQSITLI